MYGSQVHTQDDYFYETHAASVMIKRVSTLSEL